MSGTKRESEQVLAQANCLLADCLDYDGTIEQIARLTVSSLATWCIVDVVKGGGVVERVAVAHRDPEKAELARIIKTRYPASPKAQRGVYKVIETRKSILISEAPESVWSRRADDPEHLRIILELGSSSYMCVPMLARGDVVGTIIFMSSAQTYDEADLAFAEELASRFALAVDNALMFRRMQAAIRARDEFLSIAAHELRTPLTPLLMQQPLIEQMLLTEKIDTANRESIARVLAISADQVKRLSRLVNSLLDATRVESTRFELEAEHFDLSALVRDLCERFALEAGSAGCSINFLAEDRIEGQWDRSKIEQVVTNLISNAIKYGAGQPIDIRVMQAEDRAIVEVRDHGPGITASDQARLFNRFERLSQHRATQGLGLGLYIAKAIVDMHDGVIQVESKPGYGAAFIMGLPRKTGIAK